jgi:preprotein translocase subunit SecF
VSFKSAVATFRGHRQPHFNFIGRTRLWFAISGALIVLSLVGLFVIGLNYSIDFNGGAQLRYPNTTGATVADVQAVLAKYGHGDAEVQVVGTDAGESQIVIRTESLNDLGGTPQQQFTFPVSKGTTDTFREVMAEFGIQQPGVKIENGKASVVVKQDAIGKSDGVTIIYRPDPSTDLSVSDITKTLQTLGRGRALVSIIDGNVIIKTEPLDRPAPTPTPSASASPGASPSASPAESPVSSPSTAPSADASPGEAGVSPAAAVAAPTKKPGGGKATTQPSAQPSSQPSPAPSATTEPSPSTAPTPTPSASPTGPPTPKEILEALGKQAKIDGEDITVRDLSQDTQAAVVAALAEAAGVQPSQVQAKDIGGDERARLLAELADQAGIPTTEVVIKDVGPTWGAQISKKALQGLIIFLVLVTLYISFRFEWKMAVSALTALFHDLIITAGIYALTGREVTPETVIAILTILGYSLYDTVVIFDRIKENTESLALVARDGYSGVVNLSLNETLMRSVNTSLVVLLPIVSLLLFGGDTLKDFAFALFIGVTAGAYSSIFIASPMLALLKEREPRYAQMRLRAARAASRGQPQPAAAGAAAGRPLRSVKTSTAKSSTAKTSAKGPTTAAIPSGDGAAGAGDVDGTPAATSATSGQAARSGSGGRPSGSGSSGSRSKSKKRTPPAKRRRR